MNETKTGQPPMMTPWGMRDDDPEELADGVWFVTTASHGGIWLSLGRRKQWGNRLSPFLKMAAWWEEDCDARIPHEYFVKKP